MGKAERIQKLTDRAEAHLCDAQKLLNLGYIDQAIHLQNVASNLRRIIRHIQAE
jgi:uncharacterized protein (UPF0332 family)